ncbi:MAG: DUF177 domain-containing protein [Candidatus Marinimicrobia bacterium]|nr:DUF177 domain-containing protein [Candidatus Neomarinimicrobiota bacterium]
MKLKLTDLVNSQGTLEFNFSVGDISLEEINPVTIGIQLKLNIQQSGPNFKITGTANLILTEMCDRCLDNYKLDIKAPFSIFVTTQKSLKPGFSESDVILLETNQRDFNLGPTVHDAILLERSIKNLCKEDCLGLCSNCGVNLNNGYCNCASKKIDERWASLIEINFSHSE